MRIPPHHHPGDTPRKRPDYCLVGGLVSLSRNASMARRCGRYRFVPTCGQELRLPKPSGRRSLGWWEHFDEEDE